MTASFIREFERRSPTYQIVRNERRIESSGAGVIEAGAGDPHRKGFTHGKALHVEAEPREHVSYREICRQCHVTDDTVKAVERREAISIATRKEALMVQAARIAKRAYDRVEDEIDSAPLPQAVVTAGVFTDKLQLLSGDVTSRLLSVNVHADAVDLVAQFNKLHDAIRAKAKAIEAQSEETEGKTGLPSSKET